MKKIHKKGNKTGYTETNSNMISMSIGDNIDDNWEEYDVSDIQNTKSIKKDPQKGKRYATKKRKIMIK